MSYPMLRPNCVRMYGCTPCTESQPMSLAFSRSRSSSERPCRAASASGSSRYALSAWSERISSTIRLLSPCALMDVDLLAALSALCRISLSPRLDHDLGVAVRGAEILERLRHAFDADLARDQWFRRDRALGDVTERRREFVR